MAGISTREFRGRKGNAMEHELYIGRSRMGNRVCISLAEPPRIGILASSGSGKTGLLTNLVLQLSIGAFRERVQFVGFDPKLVSLHSLEPRLSIPAVTEPSKYMGYLLKIEQIMNNRLSDMQRRGWTKIDPWLHSDEYPQLIVIVEELPSFVGNPELAANEQKAIAKWFDSYLTRCRAANMGAIICSHTYASTDSISTLARSQLQTRFIGRCGIQEAHLFNEGQDEKCSVLKLTEPGEFYLSDEGKFNEWTRMKTWFTDETKARDLANRYAIDTRDIGLGWTVESPWG